jgi:hypothetical protein
MSRAEYVLCAIVALIVTMAVVDPLLWDDCSTKRPIYANDFVVIGCKPTR